MWKVRWIVCLTLLAAIAVWADEPWRDKAYQSWSANDVKRILNNSPWARQAAVPSDWNLPGHQGLEVGTRVRIGKYPSNEDDVPNQTRNPITSFILRWQSSRTIRAALAREKVQRGAASAGSTEKAVEREPEMYEIVLVVTDTTVRFPDADEFQMRHDSWLDLKRTGRRIHTARVEIRRAPNRRINEVAFFFPKKLANGEPSIPPDEEQADFNWSVGGTNIRADFKLSKMRDKTGLDL